MGFLSKVSNKHKVTASSVKGMLKLFQVSYIEASKNRLNVSHFLINNNFKDLYGSWSNKHK